MSNKQVKTNLEGYERQIFPVNLDRLNKIYDSIEVDGIILEEIGKGINGYKVRDRVTTEDGYRWFWGFILVLVKEI